MDDPRLHRRKTIRSLLLGRRFHSASENCVHQKDRVALRRCSSRHGELAGSEIESAKSSLEETSSHGSSRKAWKASLVQSFSRIKLMFLSSLSNYNPSHLSSFKNSCSPGFCGKREICSSLENIKPCFESSESMVIQKKSGFALSEQEFYDITTEEKFEAKIYRGACSPKPAMDCEGDDTAEHCEDVNEHAGLCHHAEEQSSENENGEEVLHRSCHTSKDDQCGISDVDNMEQRKDEVGLQDKCNKELGFVRRRKEFRNFPPPLPSLARTGNLPCHMPWVHLRSYKSGGRLIIKEVKVRHHEFFRAVRSNGRLILHLVQHDEGKIRAFQAQKTSIDQSRADPVKESEEMALEEVRDEVVNVDKDVLAEETQEMAPEEVRDEVVNGDKDMVVEEEEFGGDDKCLSSVTEEVRDDAVNDDKDIMVVEEEFGGNDKVLSSVGSPDKVSYSFSRGERESRLPDPLQLPIQRCSPKGLESPAGCFPATPNSLFEIPISAIRPIRS